MSDTPVLVDWIKRLEQRVAELEGTVDRLLIRERVAQRPTMAAVSLEHPEVIPAGRMMAAGRSGEEVFFTPDGAIHKL